MAVALGLLLDLRKCLRIHVVCVFDELKPDIGCCTFESFPSVEGMEESMTELNQIDERLQQL